jgi:adenosylcobinamide kinase / adenosylcobinamide-phosphate guanylyltransferase
MPLTLLTGGARSGKSALAVELARRSGRPVTFVATAPVRPSDSADHDADMASRIARHRAERPAEWTTIEEPVDLATALEAATGTLTVIDCLTLWLSNMMWEGRSDHVILDSAESTATLAARRAEPTIVVTNEVGMGIHPETSLGRRYRDLLGSVNRRWSEHAQHAYLLVAGRALRLDEIATVRL